MDRTPGQARQPSKGGKASKKKKKEKAELSGVYISEVQHGIIMNSTVLFHILHTLKLLKSTLAQRIGEVQLLGRKTYKFDFRFHFHHYLFIMRSSTLATSTLKSNVIALHSWDDTTRKVWGGANGRRLHMAAAAQSQAPVSQPVARKEAVTSR